MPDMQDIIAAAIEKGITAGLQQRQVAPACRSFTHTVGTLDTAPEPARGSSTCTAEVMDNGPDPGSLSPAPAQDDIT